MFTDLMNDTVCYHFCVRVCVCVFYLTMEGNVLVPFETCLKLLRWVACLPKMKTLLWHPTNENPRQFLICPVKVTVMYVPLSIMNLSPAGSWYEYCI